jgi:hypothetical protein
MSQKKIYNFLTFVFNIQLLLLRKLLTELDKHFNHTYY